MYKILSAVCSFLLVTQANPVPNEVQDQTAGGGQAQAQASPPKQAVLEDGTPVKLRIARTVSSADAHVDDRVEFEVLEEVKVAGVVVIPKGGIAWGTVTEAQRKRRMARGGKLEIVMDSVRLVDGEKAALRATKEAQGGGHTGGMVAGIVATGLLVWPAAPFFLFMHGKDITIPKGTEVPTFINGNFPLDLAKFQQAASGTAQPQATPAPSSSPAQTQTTINAEIDVTSTPAGAEVELDGNFVGSTPSTIGVSAGDHTITVKKNGYKPWERKIKVTSGKIAIAGELEADVKSTPPPKEVALPKEEPPRSVPVPEVASAVPSGQASSPSGGTAPEPPRIAPAPAPQIPTPAGTPKRTANRSASLLADSGRTVGQESGSVGASWTSEAGRGVRITQIAADGPAAQAGLKVGDIITELDGVPVRTAQILDAEIALHKPGSKVRISYIRNSQQAEATVTVGEHTKP